MPERRQKAFRFVAKMSVRAVFHGAMGSLRQCRLSCLGSFDASTLDHPHMHPHGTFRPSDRAHRVLATNQRCSPLQEGRRRHLQRCRRRPPSSSCWHLMFLRVLGQNKCDRSRPSWPLSREACFACVALIGGGSDGGGAAERRRPPWSRGVGIVFYAVLNYPLVVHVEISSFVGDCPAVESFILLELFGSSFPA